MTAKKAKTTKRVPKAKGGAHKPRSKSLTMTGDQVDAVARKLRSHHLPGMEPPSIPALDTAAAGFYHANREKKIATENAVEAANAVAGLMREHKLTNYTTPD